MESMLEIYGKGTAGQDTVLSRGEQRKKVLKQTSVDGEVGETAKGEKASFLVGRRDPSNTQMLLK